MRSATTALPQFVLLAGRLAAAEPPLVAAIDDLVKKSGFTAEAKTSPPEQSSHLDEEQLP